jgi:hypothetical protein
MSELSTASNQFRESSLRSCGSFSSIVASGPWDALSVKENPLERAVDVCDGVGCHTLYAEAGVAGRERLDLERCVSS